MFSAREKGKMKRPYATKTFLSKNSEPTMNSMSRNQK